ncbi:MAG: ABC transporter substrate-binding protein [Rhizobiaceae bacterium]
MALKPKYSRFVAAGLFAALLGGAVPAGADEYNISLATSLTGNLAPFGVPQVNGIRLAVEELNARKFLGEHTLTVSVQDDANDRGQVVTLLNTAAADPKTMIHAGLIWGPTVVSLAPLLNDLKIPLFYVSQTSEPLGLSEWFFKMTTSPDKSLATLANYAVEKAKIKKLAVVYMRDAENMVASTKIFRDNMQAHGVEIVSDESVLASDTNFSALATKIAATNPDSIWLGTFGAQAANIVVQLKRAGVREDVKIFPVAGPNNEYLEAGGSAVNDTFFYGDFNAQTDQPMVAEFVKNYRAKYGDVPNSWAAIGYTEGLLAAQAIKQSMPNPTREKVRAAMAAMKDVPTVLGNGPWSVDEKRVPVYVQSILVVKDKKFETAP